MTATIDMEASTSSSGAITRPKLILVADGGGSKICVVVRSSDGLEVRGTGGPCNVQSVGYDNAIQAILLATYQALSQLPAGYLSPNVRLPVLPSRPPRSESSPGLRRIDRHQEGSRTASSSRLPSRAASPSPPVTLPPLSAEEPVFQYVWCGLAGISTAEDAMAFQELVVMYLGMSAERVKITNDVNLLAAPALELPGITHAVAVVCGTGTVGRTIEVTTPRKEGNIKTLPLRDVGVSRGWGYMLCDEGSAFWMSRLAIRSALAAADRASSSAIHTATCTSPVPFHQDLLDYFGVDQAIDLIGLTALTSPHWADLSIGEAQARRNALIAGAARIVLNWAFPDDNGPPSPPHSEPRENDTISSPSQAEALRIAVASAAPLVDLILECLGDRSVVKPETTALCLGGGLWNSRGYRELVMAELGKRDIRFKADVLVRDPAGAGASGLARVEFEV